MRKSRIPVSLKTLQGVAAKLPTSERDFAQTQLKPSLGSEPTLFQ